jgi:hypothetical protein
MVSGLAPDSIAQRSFIDYDPITGRILRNALRQQVYNSFLKLRLGLGLEIGSEKELRIELMMRIGLELGIGSANFLLDHLRQ